MKPKEIYYLVECDEAVNPDKSFKLKETKSLEKYALDLKLLNYSYEIYLCFWYDKEASFYLKQNVTNEF